MLPNLIGGNRGVDPNVLALMNGNGGFGGQNGIWGVIYLAIVASIFGWNNGGFFLDMREAIPTGTTATLPILIGVNGDTRPLMEYAGKPATVENFAGAGIYEIHYNRYTNQLYIVNGGFRPSAATTPAA